MNKCSGSRSRRNCARNAPAVFWQRRSSCHLVSMIVHVRAEPRHKMHTITFPCVSVCPKVESRLAAITTFIPTSSLCWPWGSAGTLIQLFWRRSKLFSSLPLAAALPEAEDSVDETAGLRGGGPGGGLPLKPSNAKFGDSLNDRRGGSQFSLDIG